MNKTVRWLPAVLAPVVVVGGALAIPAVANGATDLPDKSPQEVLELVQQSTVEQFSGTVEQSSDLGLPELPSMGPGSRSDSSSAGVLDLLTADHKARVFVDGKEHQRVQVLDDLAERDGVHSGSDVWLYDSKHQEAVHATIAAGATSPDLGATTPPDLAQQFVDKLDPSTELSVGTDERVAGRPVYQLILTPRSDGTLVGSVTIAVDASTGMPLQVVVTAKGQESPAFSVGFSSLDLSAPDASAFAFTPPEGTDVTEATPPSEPAQHPGLPTPAVTGTGWDTVVQLPADPMGPSDGAGNGGASEEQTQLLDQLTTVVPEGRALQTSLVTVLLANDGRVFAGAVPLDVLQAAAQ